MPTPLTRQDMMAITDGAKNRILERLVTKYDIQNATDAARDRLLNTINAFHIENQTFLKQMNGQYDQANRRIAALESQINSARQEMRTLTQTLNRVYEVQAQHINDVRTRATNGPLNPSVY